MEKFQFNKVVKGEEIKDMVKKELGSTFRVELKETNRLWSRIHIAQDRLRGCIINYREKKGRTICTVIPRAPSLGLQMAIAFGPSIMLELILIVLFGVVVIGILPVIVLFFIIPGILVAITNRMSRDVFQRVAGILKNSQYIES